jgi:hypothetical protein
MVLQNRICQFKKLEPWYLFSDVVSEHPLLEPVNTVDHADSLHLPVLYWKGTSTDGIPTPQWVEDPKNPHHCHNARVKT